MTGQADLTDDAEARAYLDQVMAEIEEEVQRRRASGDLPLRVERELDELFLEFSPVAGRGGTLGEALRLLDDAAFIDPVVPVGSDKSGGAVVKKGLRSLTLWYMGFITHQVSQFASATGRALHLVDDELARIRDELAKQHVDAPPVVDPPPGRWWVPVAVSGLSVADGRVLHAACGDGWLVRHLEDAGIDAYGVDPRPGLIERGEAEGADLRAEDLLDHLRSTAPGALAGLVLTGLVDGTSPGQRAQLLDLVSRCLGTGAPLVVHSRSRQAWDADEVSPEIDLSPGRPWRPATWEAVLSSSGHQVTVHVGPDGEDYLVVAVHGGHPLDAGSVSDRPDGIGQPRAIHQFVPALIPRDATGSHTLLLREVLRAAGWRSEIFAEATHDELLGESQAIDAYQSAARPGDVLLYQFSTSSMVADYLLGRDEPLILDYHNITEPEHSEMWDPEGAARSSGARHQLARLAPRCALGIADSAFNRHDLVAAGCRHTTVAPVLVDLERVAAAPDPEVAARLAASRQRGGTDWLFVGRLVPSKGQHELVKALWAFAGGAGGGRGARLHLVGSTPARRYLSALRDFVSELGLGESVEIVGEVSDAALAAYYANADVYVSLSLHEGFGVPLVEAMRAGVPVVALGRGAVPDTVGDAAIVLDREEPALVATAVGRVLGDQRLRSQLVDAGRRRVSQLTEGRARRFVDAVATVAGPPPVAAVPA